MDAPARLFAHAGSIATHRLHKYCAGIRYLSTSEVLAIARAQGADPESYDREALYLALRRTTEGDPAEVEARIHEFAGSLIEALVQLSPYGLENERVARHALARFYELNGWTLDPDDPRLHDLVDELSGARASVFGAAAVLRGLAKRSKPR